MLPNTLWGFHRDPDRKFITFAKYDRRNKNFPISVEVNDTFDLDICVDGVHHTNETLSELSVDVLTQFFNELNEKSERL